MKADFFRGRHSRWSLLTASLLAAGLALPALGQNSFNPGQWLESGVSEKTMGYRPMNVALAPDAPAGMKKTPPDLVSPRYGSFRTGSGSNAITHLLLVDFDTNGAPARLYVDLNGSGDLSSDSPAVWTRKQFEGPDDVTMAEAFASVTVKLSADGRRQGKVEFYTSLGDTTKQPKIPPMISYHADCGVAGEFKIEGRSYPGMIADNTGAGQFSAGAEPGSKPLMWVDANGNGKVDRGETMLFGQPFQVDGKWWAATNLAPDGALQLVAAAKPAPRKPAVDLSPGKKAPAFTAKLLEGKEVKFPEDYKGKIVLLDFWATWCGPCVAEIPNVVKAYGAYHAQGFEVLGVSLDKEDWETKLAAFTKKKDMPWPQVYDGKSGSSAVAKLYGITAIPHMTLVDGDTGVILADQDIRGEDLAPAIEKALAGKKK